MPFAFFNFASWGRSGRGRIAGARAIRGRAQAETASSDCRAKVRNRSLVIRFAIAHFQAVGNILYRGQVSFHRIRARCSGWRGWARPDLFRPAGDETDMDPLEWVAAGLGVINVALVVRRTVWNYPFGIAMVALYFFVFFEAKLYSDALLQIFFFVVQLYGWRNWLQAKQEPATSRSACSRSASGSRWAGRHRAGEHGLGPRHGALHRCRRAGRRRVRRRNEHRRADIDGAAAGRELGALDPRRYRRDRPLLRAAACR